MSVLPGECGVALKEWAGVCAALAEGRQTVLLRKGGIREQPGPFVPEHPAFWLYPTQVHQAQQGLRDASPAPIGATADPSAPVAIDSLARVEFVDYVTSEEALPALEPFHIWTAETIRTRFHYRRPGLWVLAVRVFRRADAWTLVPSTEQLGCQSWVILGDPRGTDGLHPVLDDAAASADLASIRQALPAERETDL